MPNHAALISIRQELIRFESKPTFRKIKAHIRIIGNEKADEQAKIARSLPKSTLPYLDPTIIDSPSNTFLHMGGTLQEIYPRQYIKNQFKSDNTLETNNYLKKKSDELLSIDTTDINWKETKNWRRNIIYGLVPILPLKQKVFLKRHENISNKIYRSLYGKDTRTGIHLFQTRFQILTLDKFQMMKMSILYSMDL